MRSSDAAAALVIVLLILSISAPAVTAGTADASSEAMRLEAEAAARPGDRELAVRLGNLYYDAAEWERAEIWYLRALELERGDPNVLTDLAVVRRSLGNSASALELLDEALVLSPDHWQAIYNKAVVLGVDLGLEAEALALVDRLDEIRAGNPEVADTSKLRLGLEGAGQESVDPKVEDALRLVRMSGSTDAGLQMMSSMMEQFRGMVPQVPAEFWDRMLERLDTEELERLVVEVWDRHFTHQDIIEIIAFYESPVGRKLVRKQPEILAESMEAGQRWGEQIAQEIVEELQAMGYADPPES